MSAHIAQFHGGPADGTISGIGSDSLADDPKDREFPPLVQRVNAVRDGEMYMETYLREPEPMSNGHWVYEYVPPKF